MPKENHKAVPTAKGFISKVLRYIFKTQSRASKKHKRLLINLTKYWERSKRNEQDCGASLDSPGI